MIDHCYEVSGEINVSFTFMYLFLENKNQTSF